MVVAARVQDAERPHNARRDQAAATGLSVVDLHELVPATTILSQSMFRAYLSTHYTSGCQRFTKV